MKKKYWITALLFFFLNASLAQVALLDRIHQLIQNNDLKKAEEAILVAEKNTSTANDARTYYLKAFIYKELFLQATGDLRESLRDVSFSSISQCRRLDKNGDYKIPAESLFDFAVATLFNDATDKFNSQEYTHAVKLFTYYNKITSTINNYWLDARYFTGVSYSQLGSTDSAVAIFEFLKAKQYDQPVLYLDLSAIYFTRKIEDKALGTINQGLRRYPGNYELEIAELNLLSGFSKFDTLEIRVDSFLVKYPDNIEALLLAGTVYEKNRRTDTTQTYLSKSETVYKKVLSLRPDNFEANYNLGVLYYNQAVEIVNKQDFDIDITELTKILEKSTALFQTSLPFLLSVYDSNRNNSQLLHALQAIYYNLNMKPELDEVNTMINKLENGS